MAKQTEKDGLPKMPDPEKAIGGGVDMKQMEKDIADIKRMLEDMARNGVPTALE